jgi:iron complex outermembrane receptor protein
MKTNSLRTILKAGASLAIMMNAANAAAQDADTDGGDDIFSLEEITVTAQKREQSQQDVPITLNAFSGGFLETIGAETLRDINAYTPGLEISGVTQPRFKVRGVETSDFGVGTDPAVGIYIDGVYAARSGAAVVFFSDIDRVEVLKGPQGTLFGRNTAAGAVSIHTKKPEMDEFSARVKLRYGRFNKQQFDGMVNVPLGDNVAMRANLLVNSRDGYRDDALTGYDLGRQDNVTGRVQLRWEGERTTFNLAYEFDHTDQDEEDPIMSVSAGGLTAPIGAETIGDLPGHGDWIEGVAPLLGLPLTKETPLAALDSIPLAAIYGGFAPFGYTPSNPAATWDFFSNPASVGGNDPFGPVASDLRGGEEKRDLDGFAAHLVHDFEWATLTSISAYKQFTTNNLQDDDGQADIAFYLDTDNIEENKHLSQEIRLNGESGALTWMIGGSYYWEKAKQASAVHAATDSIDTTLYNLGVTPGVLAQSFNPLDGINSCESAFLDSLGGPIAFSGLPLECLNPGFVGTPLEGLSLEGVSNLALTSFGGRLWTETMYGEGTFKAYAAYADASFAVTDQFNIHAGIRYTHDSKSWEWTNGTREIENAQQLDVPGVGNLADIHQQLMAGIFQALVSPTSQGDIVFDIGALEGVPVERKDSWNNVSPRIAMDYHVNDDMMLYASYALGYKAGGYNSVEVNSFFNNEKVWNIEAGMKSQWFDNSVRLNLALWKYEYNDRQSLSLEQIDSSGIPKYVTQTNDTSGKGLDVEMLWNPTPGLRLFANAGYQDVYCTANCGRNVVGDPTGEPSTRVSVGADYNLNLGDNSGSIALHADHSYTSARRENTSCQQDGTCGMVTFDGNTWTTGEAQNFTNVRITWTNADDDISLSFFGSNIFSNRYAGGAGGIGKDTMGAAVGSPSAPGLWGIDLTLDF